MKNNELGDEMCHLSNQGRPANVYENLFSSFTFCFYTESCFEKSKFKLNEKLFLKLHVKPSWGVMTLQEGRELSVLAV